MTRFSIIVPHLADNARFEETLVSVLRYRPENSQVLVVHDGTYDDPYDLDSEVEFVEAESCELIQLLNVAMCYVGGELTVVVRPGIEVDENWHHPVDEAFEQPMVGAATPIIVSAARPSRILNAGVNNYAAARRAVGFGKKLSRRSLASLKPLGPSSWLAAYRTKALKALLPFDEHLDSVAWDLDVARSLQLIGFQNTLLSDCVGVADSEALFVEEAAIAHGASSQRMQTRSGTSGLADLLECFGKDMLQLVSIKPWRLKHLTQRFRAARFRRVDESHFLRLKSLKQEQLWAKCSEPDESNATTDFGNFRRAA